MYMYAKGIAFACFYNFSFIFWNCSDSVVIVVLISMRQKMCIVFICETVIAV
jgi:hypothetical protein